MDRKYKLTDETRTLDDGTVLYQIQAFKVGPWGPAGTFGGWVQHERNLSHEGNCWIYYNAQVYENALVRENAEIFENARVHGKARISENARVFEDAWVYGNAMVYWHAKVFSNANVFGNARVCGNARAFGDQKINGYCLLNGSEKGKKFKVRDFCICRTDLSFLEEYHGCCWKISQVYEGWVQAKHGDEEIAFRNNWLRKL